MIEPINRRRLKAVALAALLAAAAAAVLAASGGAFTLLRGGYQISVTGPPNDEGIDAIDSDVAHDPELNRYLVVWQADPPGPESEVFGQLLSAAGNPLGLQLRISTTGAEGDVSQGVGDPRVVYNPRSNEYLVVWDGEFASGDTEIFGQRLTADGAELGGDFRISTTGADGDATRQADQPGVAVNRVTGEYLVAWQADALALDNKFEIFAQRLNAAGGEMGGDFRISNTGGDADATRDAQDPPDVSFNPASNQFLVTWYSNAVGAGELEVFGQLLSTAGAEVGGDFRISNAGPEGDVNFQADLPRAAVNDRNGDYLVVWEGNGMNFTNTFEISGQRLSQSGAELGGDFRISNTNDPTREAFQPELAYDRGSDRYLVVWWSDGGPTPLKFEIFGQRLTPAGVEDGTDFRISNTLGDTDPERDAIAPAVANNTFASAFLVTWDADALPLDNEREIFAAIYGETAKCKGRRATGIGGSRRDVITGTPKRDVIQAKGGNDLVRGLNGKDLVCGGRGKDRLLGGHGRDLLRGDAGKDKLVGGTGRDKLRGGRGKDRCIGGRGRDRAGGCEKEASL